MRFLARGSQCADMQRGPIRSKYDGDILPILVVLIICSIKGLPESLHLGSCAQKHDEGHHYGPIFDFSRPSH